MQDSGKPEDAGTAEPEDARTEATRGSISRRRGREKPGQPGRSNPRPSRKVKLKGQPASDIGRRSREERSSRETESSSTGGTEELEIRGNSKICCRQSRKMQEPGQPGTCIGRRNWKSEAAGKPEADAPEALKDTRVGATRQSIAGRAGRCSDGETRNASRGAKGEIELRGNPERENRWKRRMDSRFRATWRSNAGITRRCGVRGNLQPHWETLQEERNCWGNPRIQRR